MERRKWGSTGKRSTRCGGVVERDWSSGGGLFSVGSVAVNGLWMLVARSPTADSDRLFAASGRFIAGYDPALHAGQATLARSPTAASGRFIVVAARLILGRESVRGQPF